MGIPCDRRYAQTMVQSRSPHLPSSSLRPIQAWPPLAWPVAWALPFWVTWSKMVQTEPGDFTGVLCAWTVKQTNTSTGRCGARDKAFFGTVWHSEQERNGFRHRLFGADVDVLLESILRSFAAVMCFSFVLPKPGIQSQNLGNTQGIYVFFLLSCWTANLSLCV